MKINLSAGLLFVMIAISLSCGKGVMDDNGGHSSNSPRKDSLPQPGMPANAVTPGSGTSNPYNANLDNGSVSPNDFMMGAAQSGMAEVELSRLAQSNAQDAAVKNFAQMMISDHSRANDELKSLAGKKSMTLPSTSDASYQAELQRLKALKGAQFDAEYIKIMVQDHERAVGLFQSQAQNGGDADAKAWANQTLPKLQAHLQAARDLQSKKP